MQHSVTVALILIALVAVGLSLALQNQRRRSRQLRSRFRDHDAKEQRMFSFLHDLGESIENEPSPAVLSRIIVDGIDKVVKATGGAIYFMAEDSDFLNPSYVSEECPPLITIPDDVKQKAERDPRAIDSFVRLARVVPDGGIFGHCLKAGDATHIEDVRKLFPDVGVWADAKESFSVLAAPLRYAGKDIGVLAVARRLEDGVFSDNDFAVFRSAAEQSAFAVGNSRIHKEASEKRAMESELRTAREVQRILLPQKDPVVPGFRISGTNVPARIISGDYYDYIDLGEGKCGIVIADVSGKGVPAGLLMAMCRSALRSVAMDETSPSKALGLVNRQLFPDIREDMFISMAYGILDGATGTLTLARAGHDPALCFRGADGKIESLRSPGLAIGVDGGQVFERITKDQVVTLTSGDCVLFYTDGVREAIDANEEEFGMERMSDVFRNSAPLGAEVVLNRMQEELKEFTGDGAQMDDITLVVIEKR